MKTRETDVGLYIIRLRIEQIFTERKRSVGDSTSFLALSVYIS